MHWLLKLALKDSAHKEGTIAYNSDNHSLFVVGHAHQQASAEFAVPELIISNSLSALNFSPDTLQNFRRLLNGTPDATPEGIAVAYLVGGKAGEANKPYPAGWGHYSINIHKGGEGTKQWTWSEGCQTIPASQYREFIDLIISEMKSIFKDEYKSKTIPYCLVTNKEHKVLLAPQVPVTRSVKNKKVPVTVSRQIAEEVVTGAKKEAAKAEAAAKKAVKSAAAAKVAAADAAAAAKKATKAAAAARKVADGAGK